MLFDEAEKVQFCLRCPERHIMIFSSQRFASYVILVLGTILEITQTLDLTQVALSALFVDNYVSDLLSNQILLNQTCKFEEPYKNAFVIWLNCYFNLS